MDLEQKCAVLEEFSRAFTMGEIDREFFSDFVIYNDLGLPLAQGLSYGLAEPTDQGKSQIEETWVNLCETLSLDPTEEYEDFDEMLDIFEDEIDN